MTGVINMPNNNNNNERNNYKIYFARFSNGKMYIGQTKRGLEHRINQHEQYSKDTQRKSDFYHAMRTTKGPIIWGLLERGISLSNVDERERYYIKKYDTVKNGYNTNFGGTGWYSDQFSRKDILSIYKELRNPSLSLTDIADKHNSLIQTISSINKGEIYRIDGVVYPIKQTYKHLTEKEVLDIAKYLSSNCKETPAEYAGRVGRSRKTIENINNGTSHKKLLLRNGYIKFPLRNQSNG